MSRSIQPPTNFPVTWQDAADASHFWMFDQMHAPEPETAADAAYYECAYDHGISAAAHRVSLPLRAISRRINTYSYLALVPLDVPATEAAALASACEQHINAAMGRLSELWNDEYLPEIQAHLADWETHNLTDAGLDQLLIWLDLSLERTRRLYEIHFLVLFPVLSAISQFDDLYRDLFGQDRALEGYRLLQGFENQTVRGGRALWQLSRQALVVPEVASALQSASVAGVMAELDGAAGGSAFLANLRTYLDTWGRRGERWGWSYRSWVEDPSPVIENLRDYIAQPDRDLEAELAGQAVDREQLVAQARSRLRGGPASVIRQFEFLLHAAQVATVLTEDHAYWIDFQCMYFVRRLFLELGRRFVAGGVLDQVEDVVLLTPAEMRETAERLPLLDRRPLAAGRHAEIDYFRAVSPPAMLGTLAAGPQATDSISMAIGKFFGAPPRATDEADTILGNSGSPGKARGPARVIRSLADAGKLRPGDVLVAPTTAPPWTPLFATAAAIVTDTGGILSHCAVVAREYGIPAVVGTGRATSALHDDDLVEVDGDAGSVRRLKLEDAEAPLAG